ncbi:MAG: sigma-54-dependent Fis family transcriptional regulator [Thermoanaerobaculia bacterium]|nr:sigma-54-dependent Fis family transcriptional regulator [Thermoanaerobaculia bacterium]
MRVLIVDSESESRDAVRRAFSAAGDQVRGVPTVSDGERQLLDFQPNVVIAAVGPSDSGAALAFLESARSADPSRGIYALVDGVRLEDGVSAMQRGIHDFLWKPVSEGRVALVRARFAARREREGWIEEMRLRLARAEIATSLAGLSPRWQETLAAIQREAAANTDVLITGEAGTEKESAARALHRLSPRGSEPFFAEDSGDGNAEGTRFIADIERAGIAQQHALLARLENTRRPRIILATDEEPGEAVAAGRLLPLLFETLRDHAVHLPPLRERGEDVKLLARQFLHEIDGALYFDSEAVEALLAHDWPGNVRELKEVVRRASQLADGPGIGPTVVTSVLGRPLASRRSRRKKAPVVRIAVGDSLADVERRLIQKTLEFARGNKKKTAELLKLSLKTIYNKIKEYGLSAE